ncbi:unnamed protein product [Phyllotreta striolata]|uniref:Major facilitator superfamily (MFS) profile domain-containing protein n=1 Tax=Phyllotreta striolata TaxID=444603 RepID=A0A9N9XJB0_PHYSR|nr:unnamed protein product [Phyllotreta striolata]
MFWTKNVILAVIGGVFLNFVLAIHLTWTSPVLPKLTDPARSPFGRAITKDEASWIASIFTIGSILGSQIWNYMAEKAGKKLALLFSAVPCFLSNVIIYYTTSVELYIFARFLVGLSVGSLFIYPIYIAELLHKNLREIIATVCSCGVCSGILFSNSVGPFVSIQTFSLILGSITAVFLVFFIIFGQEVPHFYIRKNHDVRARRVLQDLRGGYEDIDEAFDEIRRRYDEEKSGTLKDLFVSKSSIKAFFICISLMLFHQFSGNNLILIYGESMIRNIDPELSSDISMILLSVVVFITSLIAPPLCMRYRKRMLLIFSAMGMFLAECVLGVYIYYQKYYELPKSLAGVPLTCLTMFITAHGFGFGPLPFVILGEIFPNRVKAIASSVISLILGIVGFLMSKYFLFVTDAIGMSGFFFCCAFSCLAAAIFTKCCVIETKDKSLEQIQYELSL